METLNKTYQYMFALLRSSIWGTDRFPIEPAEDIAWEELYQELRNQTVNRLVADVLCPMDTPVSQQCLKETSVGLLSWHKLMNVQQHLKGVLDQGGIPFVVLKGAAACINYPKPTYRSMGDIDVMVQPDRYQEALELLAANGYTLGKREGDRHKELSRNGVEIELHRYYSLFAQKEAFELLDGLIIENIPNAIQAQIEGYDFPMLPPCENGLVFLEHIDHHLQGGIGLRQIIDWMMFVDRHVTDAMWEHQLGPRTEAIGLHTMAVVVTHMCQMYLGLRDDIEWCKGADEELCRQLMDIILERGNFGRKDRSHNNVSVVLHSMSGVTNTFRMLQYRGKINWQALRRYPWLKPFAWVYQICRYIRRGFMLDRPIRSLFKRAHSTASQREVFDKLGATRQGEGVHTPTGKRY